MFIPTWGDDPIWRALCLSWCLHLWMIFPPEMTLAQAFDDLSYDVNLYMQYVCVYWWMWYMVYVFIYLMYLYGTPNDQFRIDVWLNNHFLCKYLVHHPIEKTVHKWLAVGFQVTFIKIHCQQCLHIGPNIWSTTCEFFTKSALLLFTIREAQELITNFEKMVVVSSPSFFWATAFMH